MICYLAGAFSGLTKKQFNTWRLQAKNMLEDNHIHCINPATYYNTEDSVVGTYTEHEVRMFDLTAVRHSDLLLVNLEHNSIGTSDEMCEAELNNIPIVSYGANKLTHPWMLDKTTKLCNTLQEAISYILTYYQPILD